MKINSRHNLNGQDLSTALFRTTKFKVFEHTLYDVLSDSRLDHLTFLERFEILEGFLKDANLHQLDYYKKYSLNGCRTEQLVHSPATCKTTELINFASNDYLNMSQHPLVIEKSIEALLNYGAGAGASCIASGKTKIKVELEKEIADTFGKEKALVFTSGYSTNLGVLNALLKTKDVAIADLLCHSSILNGIENKNKMFFKHNDMASLENVLKRANKQYANKIVVVDGVYSMDGDIANIPEISALCKKYNALLFVDEAHGFGVIGKNGLGILDYFNLPPETIDILIGTLSKAVGSSGGFVTATEKIINYLELSCKTYLCTTGAFIASQAAALESIKIIKQDSKSRNNLWKNINYFRGKLNGSGFNTGNSETAIFPIILSDHNKVIETTKTMGMNGVHVSGVTYPLVSRKQTRVRMTVTAGMTEAHLDKGFEELKNAINNYLPYQPPENIVKEDTSNLYQQQIKRRRETLLKAKANKDLMKA